MASIKELIREIHRRSLWQVLLIYLVGSGVVLQVVEVLTATGRVPEWTPTLAFVLLLIGLPVTLATVFAREGTLGQDNALVGLIREVHRRSMWQVLGIFLAASWGVLQVVEVLTETLALPDWTATMALVALMVGLPVCVATAFVQEGLPGRAPERASADSAADGGSLEDQSGQASATRRLLSWRNAILGGVCAFALLGFSLVGYFVMWSTGIGPVGNLVAQGLIQEGALVVLADFEDATGEGIGAALTEALRVDLSEASVLDLVDDSEIQATLGLMGLESDARLTAEQARQVALREGFAAYIGGEVRPVGTGYQMTATLSEAESGASLASFRATAGGPDKLIGSIEELSQDIREKSGESLRSVRAGLPLEQVTTHSLEALTLYTEAVAARARGEGGGVPLLREAVEHDSTFAMAWRLLGVAGGPNEIVQAFRLRNRLRGAELHLVDAMYYSRVAGDRHRAIEANERALEIDADDRIALNNLAGQYFGRNDFERAEPLIRRAIAGPRRSPVMYAVLIPNLLAHGRIDAAAAAVADFRATFPDVATGWPFAVSFVGGDLVTAAAQGREQAEDPSLDAGPRAQALFDLALLAHWTGRLDEARSLLLDAETLSGQLEARSAWDRRRAVAYEAALVGEEAWARAHIRGGLEAYRSIPSNVGRIRRPESALDLALSGDSEAAELIIQDWYEKKPVEWQGPSATATVERASLLVRVARGDTSGVAETMDRLVLESSCLDPCWPFERARLHDWAGHAEAAVAFYEIVLQPGYPGWGLNVGERLHAMLRLGPLHEELGDTAKAVEAYQRMVDQWADGDARGQETVRRFRERITALGG